MVIDEEAEDQLHPHLRPQKQAYEIMIPDWGERTWDEGRTVHGATLEDAVEEWVEQLDWEDRQHLDTEPLEVVARSAGEPERKLLVRGHVDVWYSVDDVTEEAGGG